MYRSTKIIDGLSVCFRQHRAASHCSKLHGYSIKFKLVFESEDLDLNNWVADFGFLKFNYERNTQKGRTFRSWFSDNFDHTTIVAIDDPLLSEFQKLDYKGVLDLVTVEAVGCEAFAEKVYRFINSHSDLISQNPSLKIHSVECIENEKNSAIYYG